MKLTTILTVVFCLVSPLALAATIDYNDGLVHNLGYTDHAVSVDWEAPGMGTTINLYDGGKIGPYLGCYNNSFANIYGGRIEGNLLAWNFSQVTVSGGLMNFLYAYNSSQVEISGGAVEKFATWGNSHVNFSGGSTDLGFVGSDNTRITVSGG